MRACRLGAVAEAGFSVYRLYLQDSSAILKNSFLVMALIFSCRVSLVAIECMAYPASAHMHPAIAMVLIVAMEIKLFEPLLSGAAARAAPVLQLVSITRSNNRAKFLIKTSILRTRDPGFF